MNPGFRLTLVPARCYYSPVSYKTNSRCGTERGGSLNKSELVGKIAKDTGLTKSKAEAAFSSIIGSITASLKKGQKVTIVGFGTFSVAKRKARVGRNPQTGTPIKIAAHKIPKFAAGSDLKKAVK
jgi:DNA-binding protein HU-beta